MKLSVKSWCYTSPGSVFLAKKNMMTLNIHLNLLINIIKSLEPYDNLKKYIIKANPNNSIFEEVNNFNQTSKPEIDENILLYLDL